MSVNGPTLPTAGLLCGSHKAMRGAPNTGRCSANDWSPVPAFLLSKDAWCGLWKPKQDDLCIQGSTPASGCHWNIEVVGACSKATRVWRAQAWSMTQSKPTWSQEAGEAARAWRMPGVTGTDERKKQRSSRHPTY